MGWRTVGVDNCRRRRPLLQEENGGSDFPDIYRLILVDPEGLVGSVDFVYHLQDFTIH